MKYSLWTLVLAVWLCCSCTRGAFQPVNKGREYGDPVPLMVSHIGGGSPHYILQNVLCFDYLCRKKAGKKKAMSAISFEDFKKRIRKNAKKGMYKNLTPPKKAVKPDTMIVKKPLPVVAPAPAIVAEPTVGEQPVLKADSLITLGDLLFETNSSKLKGEHFEALDSLAKFLQRHPTLDVEVTGHTDSTGTERHNVALSTRRAAAVADYLVDHGANFDRISYEGFGSSRPIASNATERGRGRNRRVEVRIKKD
jgi:outer membrane protein OmpA-like peptidoglycan-associated protein